MRRYITALVFALSIGAAASLYTPSAEAGVYVGVGVPVARVQIAPPYFAGPAWYGAGWYGPRFYGYGHFYGYGRFYGYHHGFYGYRRRW